MRSTCFIAHGSGTRRKVSGWSATAGQVAGDDQENGSYFDNELNLIEWLCQFPPCDGETFARVTEGPRDRARRAVAQAAETLNGKSIFSATEGSVGVGPGALCARVLAIVLAGLPVYYLWAGSKRRLVPELLARMPQKFGIFWEPFAGWWRDSGTEHPRWTHLR